MDGIEGVNVVIERLAIVLLLGLAAVVAFRLLRSAHLRSVRPSLPGESRPALLYFYSESCAVCPTQSRIIEQVAVGWDGRLRVETIDAQRDPDTAARYGVFSLPTTLLVGGDGRVRQINYGLADATKLGRQLSALFESELQSAAQLASASEAV